MNASPAVATPPIEKGETVVGRIIATGAVVLQTAAHFGGGPGDTTDAALLRDGDGQPFIPGASIAGALRSFLRQRTVGAVGTSLEQRERYAHMLSTLFGGRETPPKQDPAEASRTVRNSEGFQSMLAVDDAFLSPNADQRALTVLRDRVRIDPERRTAADHGKFDYEALEPGAAFTVRLEFTLREAHRDLHSELKRLFNVILDALTAQEIRLGAHTRRGLGRCSVERRTAITTRSSSGSSTPSWMP